MNKILMIFFIFLNFSSSFAGEKKMDLSSLKWTKDLKKEKVDVINVCGDEDINLTVKSLKKNFLIGKPKRGYLLTNVIDYDNYWSILKNENFEGAKIKLEHEFKKMKLWVVANNRAVLLREPIDIAMNFKSSVKDCVVTGKTALGSDCSSYQDKTQCCTEKFPGLNVKWMFGTAEFLLKYGPDPSVKFKIPGEPKNRYCHVTQAIRF